MPRPSLIRRLRGSLARRWAAIAWPAEGKVVAFEGARFRLDRSGDVDRAIAFKGGHEREQIAHLLAAIGRLGPALFVDVGAHFGLYATLAATQTAVPRILAIEPDPRSLARLRENLRLNAVEARVEVIAAAASNHAGRGPFRAEEARSVGRSRLDPGGLLQVPTLRLDEAIAEEGRTIVFKIDIEGHEAAALDGLDRTLRTNRCFLQVECFEPAREALTAAMAARGYALAHRIGEDLYFARADGSRSCTLA